MFVRTNIRAYFISLFLCLTFSLSSCGGGGSSSSSTTTNGDPSGVYSGTFTESGVTYNMAGIIYNNRFVGASIDAGTMYSGNIGVSGDTLAGVVDVLIIGGGYDHTTNVSATFVPGSSITGSATDSYGTSTFSLSIDKTYNRIPYVNIAGTYQYTNGAYTATVTVSSDGTYTASDTDGCTYSGSQNAFDSTHNLYQLVLTVSNCGAQNGTYTGYSLNDDLSVQNDLLDWVINDPSFVAVISFIRQ